MALLFDGLVFGSQLALLAVGLTLVHGLGGVLNLAHGQFVVVAAMTGATLIGTGVPMLPALLAAIAAAALLAWLVELTLMRPVHRRHGEARVLLGLLVTLGVAFLLDGLLVYLRPFTVLQVSVSGGPVDVLGVRMRVGGLVALGIAMAALAALVLFLRLTRQGRAVRSVIQDEQGARLCGIDPARVRTAMFVLSGVMAGLVAVTQALVSSVGATAGLRLTVLALIVTVVGGLGRVTGTLVAGLLLGLVHAVASYHIGTVWTFVILLGAALLTILVRPAGLVAKAV